MISETAYTSTNMAITNIRAMLMTDGDYSHYLLTQFPYHMNDLTDMKILYPSLVMEIWLVRMPIKTTRSRCQVLNALVALWPSNLKYEVAVVEFKSIQEVFDRNPDITQCKKILLSLIKEKWDVYFKGKELVVC